MKRLLLAIVFFLIFHNSLWAETSAPKPLREGSNIYIEETLSPFPDIQFQDQDGTKHTLSDSAGKVRLVNFWATWCAPCIRELPDMQTLQSSYNGTLHVITISQDRKGFEAITPFIEENELDKLHHYWDKNSVEFRKLQMRGLPMSFLLDANGNLIATVQGETDWLADEIKSLIVQHSP